ncbi:DUF732 domain-containing protein [Mycobacterium shimoidei]|uniref:DUF732 domain-containing protein n=1 Tax=Mycobacterium shimoidei TaxID=29313 RepID=UPI0008495967|nr:DUF732 domain-containing protein [Mycobacterium shimoidei]MCV7259586.1 DUF732 domain-containing protein [Mycobacterium shimoidei]ODR12166.1 hypothetical protein BHQ16_16560 [Mycobacterium shimoidei]ORW75783.1 hypothetical protein AWC26_22335 [Mycobacterium shimoidei]
MLVTLLKRKLLIAAAVLLASGTVVAPSAHAWPDESMLDLYFLKLLGERGMINMGNEDALTTSTGKIVCTLVDGGFSQQYIENQIMTFMDYGPADTDIRTSVFEALAIRTYCPPTINDASWRDEPWANL